MRNVSDLKIGEMGVIKGFQGDDIPIKLLEMGCLPGNEVTLRFKAPLNDPIYVDIAGYSLAIRTDIACNILLED